MDLTAFALLHVLTLVYWLGGDLGVFYSSTILTDRSRPVAARAAAAQVLAQVDMAPRTAMILSAPTGITLADAKGWWSLPDWAIALMWFFMLGWLALAWAIHVRHLPPGSPWRQLDLFIRWAAIVKLIALALGLSGGWTMGLVEELPLFIRVKLAILAGAIACGLWIRRALSPFGPAFAAMLRDGATPETDAAIASALDRSRPAVVVIWVLLLAAAFLGLWTPA
jgi:hypothetical protein